MHRSEEGEVVLIVLEHARPDSASALRASEIANHRGVFEKTSPFCRENPCRDDDGTKILGPKCVDVFFYHHLRHLPVPCALYVLCDGDRNLSCGFLDRLDCVMTVFESCLFGNFDKIRGVLNRCHGDHRHQGVAPVGRGWEQASRTETGVVSDRNRRVIRAFSAQ